MQLKEAEKIAKDIIAELAPYCLAIEIAGAVRRRDPDVPAIEIVTIPRWENQPTGQKQLDGTDETTPHHLLFEWLESNYTVIMGGTPKSDWCILQLKDGTRIDIITAEIATWGYCWMVRTGPDAFIHSIVKQLRGLGITPMGLGLRDATGGQIATPAEQSVFDLVGMDYVDAYERKGVK